MVRGKRVTDIFSVFSTSNWHDFGLRSLWYNVFFNETWSIIFCLASDNDFHFLYLVDVTYLVTGATNIP